MSRRPPGADAPSTDEALDRLDIDTLISVFRARGRRARQQAQHEALENEIQREMAVSFGRANDKVRDAIEAVVRAGVAIDRATAEERAAAVERYTELRARALRARWELRVHRDALGLAWTTDVAERTRVPGPRR